MADAQRYLVYSGAGGGIEIDLIPLGDSRIIPRTPTDWAQVMGVAQEPEHCYSFDEFSGNVIDHGPVGESLMVSPAITRQMSAPHRKIAASIPSGESLTRGNLCDSESWAIAAVLSYDSSGTLISKRTAAGDGWVLRDFGGNLRLDAAGPGGATPGSAQVPSMKGGGAFVALFGYDQAAGKIHLATSNGNTGESGRNFSCRSGGAFTVGADHEGNAIMTVSGLAIRLGTWAGADAAHALAALGL